MRWRLGRRAAGRWALASQHQPARFAAQCECVTVKPSRTPAGSRPGDSNSPIGKKGSNLIGNSHSYAYAGACPLSDESDSICPCIAARCLLLCDASICSLLSALCSLLSALCSLLSALCSLLFPLFQLSPLFPLSLLFPLCFKPEWRAPSIAISHWLC